MLALSLALLQAAWAGTGEIAIGMSAAFRGPSRGLGIEIYRGSMSYLQHVNAAGGIHGRTIVVKTYDDGYQPIPAIENTIDLVEKDDVLLLFDYVGTPTVTRVLPLLKRYSPRSMYLFFPFTGAQPQREPPYDAFVFNLRASYREETEGLVDNFVRDHKTRIAVFIRPMRMEEAAGTALGRPWPSMAWALWGKPHIAEEPSTPRASSPT